LHHMTGRCGNWLVTSDGLSSEEHLVMSSITALEKETQIRSYVDNICCLYSIKTHYQHNVYISLRGIMLSAKVIENRSHCLFSCKEVDYVTIRTLRCPGFYLSLVNSSHPAKGVTTSFSSRTHRLVLSTDMSNRQYLLLPPVMAQVYP
jgi:hypothetical protein